MPASCRFTTRRDGAVDNYDYSSSLPFIDKFQNPFESVPFIDEMEENYGKLWQFKNCIRYWTLGVSRFKNYVYLLHRESNRGNFLPLNLNEKVILLENFYQGPRVCCYHAPGRRQRRRGHGAYPLHCRENRRRCGSVRHQQTAGHTNKDVNGGASSGVGVEACSLDLHISRQCIPEN